MGGFLLKSIFVPLIWIGFIGVPILIGWLFLCILPNWSKYGIGKIIKYIFFIGYSVFMVSFLCLSFIIHQKGKQTLDEQPTVIMVLGAGLFGEEVSPILALRLDKAIEIDQATSSSSLFLVTGGQGKDEERTEASAMAEYLEERGIDKSRILLEDQSTSTHENFLYSKEILDERVGIDSYSTIFVTSKFHVFRAEAIAKKMNWALEGMGSEYKNSMSLYYYLREYFAIIYYRLTGSI